MLSTSSGLESFRTRQASLLSAKRSYVGVAVVLGMGWHLCWGIWFTLILVFLRSL